MKVKDSSHIAQTHNTYVKMVNEFIEHVKKFHLKTGKKLSMKTYLLVLKITVGCTQESLF
jgi:hypothetical protein